MTRLKELREQREISQRQLAKEVGISFPAVNRLETRDDVDPSWSTVQKLAQYFGVSVDYLMNNDTNVTIAAHSETSDVDKVAMVEIKKFVKAMNKIYEGNEEAH